MIKNSIRKFQAVPIAVRLGLLGVMTTFIAVAGFNALTLPWAGAYDSMAHLDYAWNITNGTLPPTHGYGFEHTHLNYGSREGVRNMVAGHPPLFYAIFAAIAFPLIDTYHWEYAVAMGRMLNIFFGLLTIGAMAWGAWKLSPKPYQQQLTVLVPALSILITPYIKVAGDIYNEPIVVLLSTLSLVLSGLIIKNGLSTKLVLWLALVSALGMLSKATFAGTLIVSILAIIASAWVHNRPHYKQMVLKAGVSIASVGAAIVAAVGWFYVKNALQSGDWFRSTPKNPVGGREYQSVVDNLLNPDYYIVLPGRLLGIRQWEGILPINMQVSLIIFALAIVGLIIFIKKRPQIAKQALELKNGLVIGVMVLQVGAVYAMQLQHATGWGNLNPRYLLTALLPLGFFMAFGMLGYGKFKVWLVGLIMSIMSAAVVINSAWFLSTDGRYQQILPYSSTWLRLFHAIELNHMPIPVIFIPIVLMVIGIIITVYALGILDKKERLAHD